MAIEQKTIKVPDPVKTMKLFWKNFRAIVWTLILAMAVAVALVPDFSPFLPASWRGWIIFIAAGIYFLPQMRSRFGLARRG